MNQTDPKLEEDRIKAQFAFGLASGVMPDFKAATAGQNLFLVDIRFSVSVMHTHGNKDLCVPYGETNHDIYVLYDVCDEYDFPIPLGWAWGTKVRSTELTDGKHVVPYEALNPMDTLVKMMKKSRNREAGQC